MMRKSLIVIFLALICGQLTYAQCSTVPVKEAVRNGDFELGYLPSNTKIGSRANSHDFTPGGPLDFSSDLQYMGEWNGGGSTCNYSMGDAYGVGRVENPACSPGGAAAVVYGQYGGATTYKDHTTGTKDGYSLIVDFNSSSGGAYKTVWSQNVDVYPDQVYYFSAWFAKYGANTTPTLRFRVVTFDAGGGQIDDQVVGSAGPTKAWNFDQFLGSYSTPSNAATAQLYIECISTGQSNSEDFFVDDISFINSCQNIASQISYTVDFADDTVNLCEVGGSYTAQVKNNSGSNVSAGGKTVTWFEGAGNTQTEVAAWSGQTSVNITQPGEYRVCIMDAANNGCSVNSTVVAKEEFPLTIPNITLCSPATYDLDAGVDIPNGAMSGITWSGPSGTDNDRNYTVTTAGQHNVTVTAAGGGGCNANINFNVTSNLPDVPTNLSYCSGGGTDVTLSIGDGNSYLWSTDQSMSPEIGTGTSVTWSVPSGTTGGQTVWVQSAETTPLGTTGPTLSTSSTALTTVNTNITTTETVKLVSAQMGGEAWTGGCGAGGKTNATVQVRDGATVIASTTAKIPCGSLGTVNLGLTIPAGSYKIRVTGGPRLMSKMVWSGSAQTYNAFSGKVKITGYSAHTGALGKMVFESSQACDPVPVIIKDSVCCTQLAPTASQDQTVVCVGESVTLTATPDAGTSGPITYQWYCDTGMVAGATSDTYAVPNSDALAATDFWVTVTSSASCSGESPISNKVNVTINPMPTTPTITINPNATSFCANEAHDLTAASTITGGGSITYTWSNAITANGANQNGVTSPAGSYTYKVVAESSGCKDSVEQVITVNSLDSAELTVDTVTQCANTGDVDLAALLTAGSDAGTFAGTSVTGTNFSTAIAAGVYKVVYTTSGSCPESDSVYINVVGSVEGQIIQGDTTVCKDTPAFGLPLTATSATDGTWSGTGYSAGNFDPTGLNPGDYLIKYVKNGVSAACSDSDSVTVTIAPLDTAVVSDPLPSLCSTDPAVQLTLGGGTTGGVWTDSLAANTYVDASGLFDPTGLTDGQYKVYYATTGNCPGVDSGYVRVTSDITYTKIATDTTFCANFGLDTLNVDVAGGEIWTQSGNGVVSAGERIFDTRLMAVGTDVLYYGKSGSCGDTIQYTITINPIDTAVIDSVTPVCADLPAFNYTITGSATGGTWSGTGITDAAAGTFDPATAGTGWHQIIYTTAGACPIQDTTNILVKPRLDATLTADTVAFCGAAQPALVRAAQSGGTWTGWAGSYTSLNDSVVRFDPSVANGQAFLYYEIDSLCGDTDSVEITVSAMEEAYIDSLTAVCADAPAFDFGFDAGQGTTTTGGTWSGTGITDAGAGTFDPATAGAGWHNIKYQTPGGCYVRDSVNILVKPRLDATLNPAGPLTMCGYDNAVAIQGASSGGVWSGSTFTAVNDSAISFDPSAVAAGAITITYGIDSLCGDTATIDITVDAVDSAAIDGAGPFCQSDSPANLTVTAGTTTGGVWTGDGITNGANGTFDPQTANMGNDANEVIYTTQGTCPVADTVRISVVGQIVAVIDNPSDTIELCANAANYTISLTAQSTTGGTWSSVPAGMIDASTGEFNTTGVGNAGGTYDIKYAAYGGTATCRDSDQVVVKVLPVLDPTVTGEPANPVCKQDGSFTGFGTSGDAGGTWTISGGGSIDAATGIIDLTATNAGTYTVTYSHTGTCPSSDVGRIIIEDTINAAIQQVGPFCENLGAQALTPVVTGGVWGGAGVDASGNFNPSNVGAGTHTVTYTQTNACVNVGDIDIVVEPVPTISVTPDVTGGCEPQLVVFRDESTSDATSTTWVFEDGTTATDLDSTTKTFNGGCYGVTVLQSFANGCVDSASFTNLVCVDAQPTIDFTWSPEKVTVLDPSAQFTNATTGATDYNWSFDRAATPGSSTEQDPYVLFESEDGDTFNICLEAVNGFCTADTCKPLIILNNVTIYIPNSFTPNGDGLNDVFYPGGKFHDNSEGLDEYEFVVYNRWGELVWQSTTPYQGWDGTHKGTQQPVQLDVYVWKIKIYDPITDQPVTQSGTVTVVR